MWTQIQPLMTFSSARSIKNSEYVKQGNLVYIVIKIANAKKELATSFQGSAQSINVLIAGTD